MSTSFLADIVLVVHFAVVVFIAGGLALVLAGGALKWKWVKNRTFRVAHICVMGFVLFESLIGMSCPLTLWEKALRRAAGQAAPDGDFIPRLVGGLMFYDFPPWVFQGLYALVMLLMVVAWLAVPPLKKTGREKRGPNEKPEGTSLR